MGKDVNAGSTMIPPYGCQFTTILLPNATMNAPLTAPPSHITLTTSAAPNPLPHGSPNLTPKGSIAAGVEQIIPVPTDDSPLPRH